MPTLGRARSKHEEPIVEKDAPRSETPTPEPRSEPAKPVRVVYTREQLSNKAIDLAKGLVSASQTASRERSAMRLLWLFIVVFLFACLLEAIHTPYTLVDISRPFDPAVPLTIGTYGCDVRVEADAHAGRRKGTHRRASGPRLRLTGMLSSTHVRWGSHDGNRVFSVNVRSAASCARLPFLSCATVCMLTVYAPADAEMRELHVSQDVDDPSAWLQLRVKDASFGVLRIRGPGGNFWDLAGPTLDVQLARVRVGAGFLVALGGGSLRCEQCAIGQNTSVRVTSEAGSIYIDSVMPGPAGTPLWLDVRQPMDYVCIAAEASTAAPPAPGAALPSTLAPAPPTVSAPAADAPAPPAAALMTITPPSDPWATCRTDEYALKLAYNLYDTDKDFFINRHELIAALPQLPICCGETLCPFASFCDPLSWRVFPSVLPTSEADESAYAGRADVLSNAAFLRRVMLTNYTGLVPLCRQRITVVQPAALAAPAPTPADGKHSSSSPPPPPPPPAASQWMVQAEAGQASFALRAHANSSWSRLETPPGPGGSSGWPPRFPRERATYWAPENRYRGVRMLQRDAEMLQKQVGPQFGDLDSTGRGYVLFDVPAAPGVPRSLWVYVTQPVYHILEPAALAHFSFGTLLPHVHRYRVRFHDATCDANLTRGELVGSSCEASYQADWPGDNAARCSDVIYDDHARRLAQVWSGLERAIKSDGWDARKPRGQVLLVGEPTRGHAYWEFLSAWRRYGLYEFSTMGSSGGGAEMDVWIEPLRATSLAAILHAAVVIAVLAALLLAVSAEVGVHVAAKALVRAAWRDKRSKLRMFERNGLDVDHSELLAAACYGGALKRSAARGVASLGERPLPRRVSMAPRARGRVLGRNSDAYASELPPAHSSAAEPDFDVFEVPLAFISVVFIEPIRRAYVDSVAAFVRDKCALDEGQLASAGVRAWRERLFRSAGASHASGLGRDGTMRFGAASAFSKLARSAHRVEALARWRRFANLEEDEDEGDAERGGPPPPPPAPPPLPPRPTAPTSSISMADWVFHYEIYCFQHGLDVVHSVDALQRALIGSFGCRVSSSPAVEYRGIIWKEDADSAEAAAEVALGGAANGVGPAPGPPPAPVTRADDDLQLALAAASGAEAAASSAVVPSVSAAPSAQSAPPAPLGTGRRTPPATTTPTKTAQRKPSLMSSLLQQGDSHEEATGREPRLSAGADGPRLMAQLSQAELAVLEADHPPAALKPSATSAEELTPEARAADYRQTIRAFVAERCVVVGDVHGTPESKREPSAPGRGPVRHICADRGPASADGPQRGLHEALRAFCAEHGRLEPTRVAVMWELSQLGVTINRRAQRTLTGIKLATNPAQRQRGCSSGDFMREAVTVVMHFIVLLVPSTPLFLSAMYAQEVYASTSATRQPLLWQHMFELREPARSLWTRAVLFDSGGQVLWSVRAALVWLSCFFGATILHMGAHYLDLPPEEEPGSVRARVRRAAARLYALILGMHIFIVLVHTSLTLTWMMLAAVLEPTTFLPVGTAMVVGTVVVLSTRREMVRSARALKRALEASFNTKLQVALRKAWLAFREEQEARQTSQVRELGITAEQIMRQNVLDVGPGRGAHQQGPLAPPLGAPPSGQLQPAEVFAMLTSGLRASADGDEGDTSVTMAEFEILFEKLDLQLSRARREQLFAYMDISGDGRIDQREFEDGWAFLVEQLIQEVTEQAGISSAQIVLAVTVLVLWLILVFAFIFLAIQGWVASGSFESAVQSIFVGVAGGVLRSVQRHRPQEYDEADVNVLVADIMTNGSRENAAAHLHTDYGPSQREPALARV